MAMDVFIIDRKYMEVLEYVGLSVETVLKKAQLPENLFCRKSAYMNTEEYIRFIEAIKELCSDNTLPLKIATVENLETFSPPMFAAYCSKNSLMCFNRLSQYKKLIGSLIFNVEVSKNEVSLEMLFEQKEYEIPEFLVASEMIFTLEIIRKATKNHIIPKKIVSKYRFDNSSYENYFCVMPKVGQRNMMIISMEDATLPFISRNDSMWDYFEPELNKRLNELTEDDSYKVMVKAALMQLLPRGEVGIENVAQQLGCSKRTLQRKLNEEGTTFQKELNSIRKKLAEHYISKFNMTNEEIAYLVGYSDANSFVRAFHSWAGMTILAYKNKGSLLKNKVK